MAGFRRQPDDPYGQQYPQQPQQPAQPYPYGGESPYQRPAPPPYGDPYADPADPYVDPGGYYDEPGPQASPPPAPAPPPLPWKELLSGIVLRPSATFWHMRDYSMWWPALLVTFFYGLIAVFGLDSARESILDTTTSTLVPYLLVTGVVMVGGALLLGTVTHNLARQFGGNGLWAPTAGLAMLIMALTDVPRLAVALFLGGADPVVQVIGWATWLGAGALFTMMVSRSHEIAWPRALAASSIQLLAILALVKLGTL